MKKTVSVIVTLILLLYSLPSIAAPKEKYNPFDDVGTEHYAYQEISYLYIHDIIGGKSKTEFMPEDNIKREELAKVIVNSLGGELSQNSGSFDDVVSGSWYEPFVETCKEKNIYKGISEKIFGVGSFVTKEDCAVLLYRLSDIKKPVSLKETIDVLPADCNDASDYAKEAIKELSHRGVIRIEEGEKFNPKSYATRAEVCVMLYGVLTLSDKMWDTDQWYNYDKTVEDDRLSAQMPPPFNVDNYRRIDIASYDFDSDDYGDLVVGYCPGTWTIEETGGVNDSGCVRIEQGATARNMYQLHYKAYGAKKGDWFIFSCKFKAEGLTTKGRLQPLLEAYNSNIKWLTDDAKVKVNDGNMKDNEWTEYQSIVMIPEVANTLDTEEEFYQLDMSAVMESMESGSVAYVDDFKLQKILFDPMETALVTPNYKGLIYGDGGISDINLRVWINDYNGGYDVSDFKYVSRLEDESGNVYASSEIENVTDVMEVTYSSDKLKTDNDYYLVSEIRSKKSGELVQTQEWTIRKRSKDYRPYIYYDEYNRMIQNGEPVLPLFQYTWGSDLISYEEHIEANKGTAVDVLQIGDTFHQKYRELRTQDLRKRMLAEGWSAKLSMAGYAYSDRYSGIVAQATSEQTDIRKLLELFAKNFKDDPLLFCYYVWDEPNPVRHGEEYRWVADILSNADIDHPTYGCLDNLFEGNPGVFQKMADIINCDPYVCTGSENQKLGDVTYRIKKLASLTPNKPYGVMLQGFWFKARGDKRGPNEQEYRNMTWQALCAGVSFIDNYAMPDVYAAPWDGKTPQEIWNEQMLVLSEVEYMTPVLLSREPAPYYEVKGGGSWLNTTSRRHDGKSYLFAVNNDINSKQCRIYLDGVRKIKSLYTDKEYTADKSGWFKIDFESYGVDIFEYEQEDYLSSHCELTRFGVSNENHSYIVTDYDADEPVINIDDNAGEIDYKATVSDFAKVFINGTEVSANGKISIAGMDKLNVQVVSQDGRFKTEKNYKILRNNAGEEVGL